MLDIFIVFASAEIPPFVAYRLGYKKGNGGQ
jgi:hypothetical protein